MFEYDYDMEACGENPEIIKNEILDDSWDVTDEQSTFRALNFLGERGGHRTEFNHLRRMISILTPKQQDEYIQSLQDKHHIAEMKVVQRYYPFLPPSEILAWDAGRSAFICHLCYQVGYITYEQAWAHLMQNAIQIQSAYSSWEEFGSAFIIGRQFWRKELDDDYTEQHLSMIHDQLANPDHIWNTLPWNLHLEPWS